MNLKLSLAPIQGITDYVFRNAFNEHFGGVDEYFAPYLRIDKDKQVKKSKLKDILPENNQHINLIPQIMVNNSEDFIYLANYLSDLGYNDINWNLGCPYPMVTNRKLGAGLLPYHDTICDILETVLPKIRTKVSIKLRSGLNDDKEIEKLLPMFNPFPITEIIFHPRYAKQLYKESANLDLFIYCQELCTHSLCYNGDINSLSIFHEYESKLNNITRFMLGRGLVANPFLASEIKNDQDNTSINKLEVFKTFHETLFMSYSEKLSDNNHVLSRMKAIWLYFSEFFIDTRKVYKKIKKSTTINKYHNAISEIFREYSWQADSKTCD